MQTTKSDHLIAVSECIAFTLIAGSTLVFSKIALDYLGPLTITGLRFFLAFLVLSPFMFFQHINLIT